MASTMILEPCFTPAWEGMGAQGTERCADTLFQVPCQALPHSELCVAIIPQALSSTLCTSERVW